MRFVSIIAAMLIGVSCAIAGDDKHREAKAHEHGHGTVNVAIDGNQLAIELEAPGSDIVGFEHAPKSDAQRAAISEAVSMLKSPTDILGLPAAAGCTAGDVSVEQPELSKGEHNEFHVNYTFTCSAIDKLDRIEFKYFAQFKGAEELEGALITNKKTRKIELSRDERALNIN